MKLSHLFTVPTGEKVTEKAFLRVLISSVCSMLLCMGCLFGTTWAWFTLEINNPQNEIQIAKVDFAELTLTKGGNEISKNANTGAYDLTAGTYSLKMVATNDAAAPKRAVYVVMTLRMDQTVKSYYFPLLNGEGTVERADLLELTKGKATLSFAFSWVIPASASVVPDETIQVTANADETATKEPSAEEEKPQSTTDTTPPVSSSTETPSSDPAPSTGTEETPSKTSDSAPEEPVSTDPTPTEETNS